MFNVFNWVVVLLSALMMDAAIALTSHDVESPIDELQQGRCVALWWASQR
jgi:hypothetical protein